MVQENRYKTSINTTDHGQSLDNSQKTIIIRKIKVLTMRVYGSYIARNADVAEIVEQKYGEGYSLRQIVKIIESQYNKRISPQTVKNHLDRQSRLAGSIATGETILQAKISETYARLLPDLNRVNAGVWHIINTSKNDKIKLNCAIEIRKQLEFQALRLEKIMRGAPLVKTS